MTASNVKDSESLILETFLKNTTVKLDELDNLINIIISNGCNIENIEKILQIIITLKTYASTCDLKEITAFLNANFEAFFNTLKNDRNRNLNNDEKIKLKANLENFKKIISTLQNSDSSSSEIYETETLDAKSSLLKTVGQLSIWSHHDILNALAKLEGLYGLISDAVNKIENNDLSIKNEIKVNLEKTIENHNIITNLINQIRSIRGKTLIDKKEYKIKELIQDAYSTNSWSKKMINWTLNEIPDISILCDKIIFSQLWNNLWKLLQEWQAPNALLNPAISAKISPLPNKSLKYQNQISIYIWSESLNSYKFLPEELTFSKITPQPDINNIFFYSTKIAEKISAKVSCSKTSLGNALFCIEFPCSEITKTELKSLSQNDSSTNTQVNQSNSKCILIVDDEKDLRTVLSLKINRMGYTVCTAANLKEAQDILNEKNIALVISDIFIQNESGLDLFKSLNKTQPNLPFIFITGADEDDIALPIFDLLSNYGKAFLTKPIATKLLKETIDKILG